MERKNVTQLRVGKAVVEQEKEVVEKILLMTEQASRGRCQKIVQLPESRTARKIGAETGMRKGA